jgi:nucleotide-binding universal stress UspA family protein
MWTTQAGRAVVAGVDGSDCALQAVRWAAVEATRRGGPLRLLAAYAWPTGDQHGDHVPGGQYRATLRAAARQHLVAAAREVALVAPGLEVEPVVSPGFPAAVLQAGSARADVLVLGGRGVGGAARLTVGSVAVNAATHARCALVVVREPVPAAADRSVVLGVDGSSAGEATVAFAFDAAARRRVPLVAVRAGNGPMITPGPAAALRLDAAGEQQILTERLAGWADKYPEVPVRTVVVRTRTAWALVEESARAQLVVVGSRGWSGPAGSPLGSVSRVLLVHAHCPVAVVRGDGTER